MNKINIRLLTFVLLLSQLVNNLLTQATIVFKCDFDTANSATGCDGRFSYSSNSQKSGVVNSISGVTTELKFDLTDLTSISKNFYLKYFLKFFLFYF
jgi:hypothetical protein